jgi:predicted dehydrogenase
MGDRMRKLRLAVVGCGEIAGFMALVSRGVPQVRLTSCCDPNQERAGIFARRHRVPQVFTQYSELLQRAQIDAVYLAVPHDLHYDMIQRFVFQFSPGRDCA